MIAIDTSVLPNAVWESLRKIPHPLLKVSKKEAIKNIYKQLKTLRKRNGFIRSFSTMKQAKKQYYSEINETDVYINNLYMCFVERSEDIIHISFKTHDKKTDAGISWQHKQWIKNDICGEESEGLEMFPAESRIVNMANQYHLWVLTKNKKLPFGFCDGEPLVNKFNGEEDSGANQTYQER